MKVAELIALLKQQPSEMEVLVQSYEEGYDPVTEVRTIPVASVTDKPWYSGVYDEEAQSSKLMLVIQSRYNRADKEEL